ncbi:sugar phosphate isomerase/epimerase [Rhizobium sp. BK650]|uniref:sugar phosphate isomerase/epimerase family protein n=1 Tax=Rhizobium sp. BK650 TaxID=2586990 RepID=UPI0017B22FD3|nr:sugar phosphate isomerase/epimerase [Rhizobium sp. BK650]MBB3655630.1 sugar phosphate isomerase/epimerase [Rhizobium sp. BK650]
MIMITKPMLSLQLFSMRGLGDLGTQLQTAARAGYRAVEPLEGHLRDADLLRDGLLRNSLSAPSAHVGLEALRSERQRFVEACRQCGIGQLFVPHPAPSVTKETKGAWQRIGHELGALAEQMKADGIVLGYHNKTAGFERTIGGRYGFELMFEAARGSPLVWQADIAWLARAQPNAGEWIRHYASVLTSVHVKDQAPDGIGPEEDGWANIGSGVLLWPSLWQAAVASGARLFVVEHDNPRLPFEFAARSYAYLSRFLT